MLADRTGLTSSLSAMLVRRGFDPLHDRGRVLADVATAIARGARDIVDVEALRAQAEVFGPVARTPPPAGSWTRSAGGPARAIGRVRAADRAHVWDLLPGGLPESRFAGGMCQSGMAVLRIDGSIVVAHSKKERAAPTFKKRMATTRRVIVRRTKLAPGEQPTLFHLDGYKYSCFVTNTGPGLSVQLLDARHRADARGEDRVRTGKDTGLGHLPSKSWTINLAWCHAVAIAVDLLAWLKLLGCPDIPTLAKAEPATLRYRLLHVPARLVRHARIRWLHVPAGWPWAAALTEAFDRIRALPPPQPG
jgi:hypothetical protein